MPGSNSKRIFARQIDHGFIGSAPAHQALARGFTKGQPKADARHRAYQCLVDIFDGFDKVRLPQDEIDIFRFFNFYGLDVHAFLPPGWFGSVSPILPLKTRGFLRPDIFLHSWYDHF